MPRIAFRRAVLLGCIPAIWAACDQFADPLGSDLQTAFTILFETVTTGTNLDPDGYRVHVDEYFSRGIRIGANDREKIGFIGQSTPFWHRVTLEGVADNCEVQGPNPRNVGVGLGGEINVTFEIECR